MGALSTSSYKSDVSQKSSNKSSGVEETSITASEVIEKFENETQAFNENESNSNSINKEPLKDDENSMEEKQKEDCGKSAVSAIKLSKSKIVTDKNNERKEISKSTNTKSANGMNNKKESNGISSKVGDKSKVITRNGRNLIKNA